MAHNTNVPPANEGDSCPDGVYVVIGEARLLPVSPRPVGGIGLILMGGSSPGIEKDIHVYQDPST